MPDNKYCTQCTRYTDNYFEFREKYGTFGCRGIPQRSGEFPYHHKAHCFTDKPLLTVEEKKSLAMKDICSIIKEHSTAKASEIVYDKYARK